MPLILFASPALDSEFGWKPSILLSWGGENTQLTRPIPTTLIIMAHGSNWPSPGLSHGDVPWCCLNLPRPPIFWVRFQIIARCNLHYPLTAVVLWCLQSVWLQDADIRGQIILHFLGTSIGTLWALKLDGMSLKPPWEVNIFPWLSTIGAPSIVFFRTWRDLWEKTNKPWHRIPPGTGWLRLVRLHRRILLHQNDLVHCSFLKLQELLFEGGDKNGRLLRNLSASSFSGMSVYCIKDPARHLCSALDKFSLSIISDYTPQNFHFPLFPSLRISRCSHHIGGYRP